MQKVIIILLTSLFISTVSFASFDSAMSSYEKNNYSAASTEFKKLAAENDSDAQYMLGYMHATGKGFLQDYIAAHQWFNLAASNGNTDAIKARQNIEGRMSKEQIAQAQKQARAWQPGLHQTPLLSEDDLSQQIEPEPEIELSDKKSIRLVQVKLTQLGYQPGIADGAIGANTRRAIRQYQYDNNLLEDAKITQTLFASLFPDGEPEPDVQEASTNGQLFPDIWGQNDNEVQEVSDDQLREELSSLIEKGRESRAAQTWFLNELSALIKPQQNAWPIIFRDDFQDGNFSVSPEWSVISGRFSVNNQGLLSQVKNSKKTRSQTNQDFSTAILGAILEHANRKEQNRKAAQDVSAPAMITSMLAIPNQFALKVKLSMESNQSQIKFGPFTGAKQNQGYQLHISTHLQRIELLRVNSRGSSVIESKQVAFSVNQEHEVEWLRDASGMMTIALDGEQLFQTIDRGYQNDFSGFMLQNLSGSMVLHEITIAAE